MILLDTHIWLWWLMGGGQLRPDKRARLDKLAMNGEICISWVSIWETEMLERKNRVHLGMPFESWLDTALHPDYCKILPVDREVVCAQRKLPDYFHSDPADRLITATALLAGIPLATLDSRIIDAGCVKVWA